MSQTLAGRRHAAAGSDERVGRRSRLARLLARPEAGALVGAIVIYIFFFIVAPPFRDASSLSTILYVSSTYGILAVAVALLMIGGEFDLSAGVAVTTRRAGRLDVQLPVHRERVGRGGRRAGVRAAGRVHQRLSRGEDRASRASW